MTNKPKTYYVENVTDVVSEMLERSQSIHYMIDSLRKEINLLPELTGSDEICFQSITRCINVIEQLSFDNLHELDKKNKKYEECEATKQKASA